MSILSSVSLLSDGSIPVDNKTIASIAFVVWVCSGLALLAHEGGPQQYINRFGLYDLNPGGPTGITGAPGNADATVKQIIYTVPQAGDGVFVTIGQSRISNQSMSTATQYTPTNGVKCLNLNPYDGNVYQLIDPVFGATSYWGNPTGQIGYHGQLCDSLINAGKYTRVFFIPTAQDGASVADFLNGGIAFNRVTVPAQWLTYLGWTPTAWLWQQGNADCIAGMSQATYTADLRSVISYERGLSGRSSDKWMIALDSIMNASGGTCSGITAAQTAVGGDSNNFVGPNANGLPTTDYDATLHFNNTGNTAMSGLWSTKIQANF
jgi:hypothetical protein